MDTDSKIRTINLSDLFEQTAAAGIKTPKIKGYIQILRIKPDLFTGEILNAGVIFQPLRSKAIYSRLIPTAYPFKILYGNNGMDNFGFLLKLIRDSLSRNSIPKELSPHIVWGERSFAQGETIEEILNYTYHTMITLADVKPEKDDGQKVITINNEQARQRVGSLLKKSDPIFYERIYRKKPINSNFGDKHIKLDIPLYESNLNIENPRILYGNIVSAVYRDDVYRGFYLNHGVTEMHNASYCLKDALGSFYILRPTSDQGYNKANLSRIDTDIDKARFSLERHDIKVYIEDDLNRIATKIQYSFH